jgi:asparagine synthase (glutamine-hydrolysing)
MCGIAGFYKVPGASGDGVPVRRVVAAMHHRGPDDHGVFSDANATLIHTRLSIIDPGATGHQPMQTADGRVAIVFNGEIYNYRELRDELTAKGHKFASTSDTEVILRLYLEVGQHFVERLRGMFAIAIYDTRDGAGHEKLLLTRDPFGIKPLLYIESGGGVVFASELKALLATGLVKREIDPVALRDLLTIGSVYQPRTLIRGVRTFRPGTIATITRGRTRLREYWGFGENRLPELGKADAVEAKTVVHDALSASVKRQLIADVPVCCFLSGGIDSALTTALMVRHHNSQVNTYSVGFEDAALAAIDESNDAEIVARYLGTNHHHIKIGDADIIGLVDQLGIHLDQPSIDGVNSYFVSSAVSKDYKVALSGTGGDELFAGYPWFKMAANAQLPPMAGLLAPLARRRLPRHWQNHKLWQAAYADRPGMFARQHQALGLPNAMAALSPDLREGALDWRDSAMDFAHLDTMPRASILNRFSALCLNGYTRNQLLRDVDAMSMACSLEVRVPFLDPDFADVAMSLPDEAKIGPIDPDAPTGSYGAEGIKRVLLDVGEDLLFKGFAARPKRGFNMPVGAWLNGPLKERMYDALSPAAIAQGGLLDPDFVSGQLKQFEDGAIPPSFVWTLLAISLWTRQVFSQ